MKTLTGANLRKMFLYGYGLLDKNKAIVDSLNVFPVPDGDTGVNMSLTLKSVVKELDLVTSNDVGTLCEAVTRGALKGARGNSGVILSQILKGLMLGLGTRIDRTKRRSDDAAESGVIDVKDFAEALAQGADTAYKAVTVPKEGTILTVVRVMAEEAKKIAKQSPEFEIFFERLLAAGETILAQTPEMLPPLKKAGVVDAGGRGLLIMFAGFLAVLKGDETIEINFDQDRLTDGADAIGASLEGINEIEFAYCTEFMITHLYKTTTLATIDSLRDRLQRTGDSVICVGDLSLVKVHVHTNTPGEAITAALRLGEMINLKIDNMLEQNREIRKSMQIAEKEQGIVAIAAGEGLINVFKDLGVDYVIKGGQTMNPSAEDIAEACRRVHAKNVFVFPNNKNITLAARHAQALVDKKIIVIPSKSINEGISACIAFNPDSSVEDNTAQFIAAIDTVKSGAVTYASRNTQMNRFDIKEGDIIGLDDKAILAKGKTPSEVAFKLVEKMMDENVLNVSLFYGSDVREKDAGSLQDKLMQKFPSCEINAINGGQPVYYYLISLE
jgi:DAK2 domain fusion protein YloV